MADVSAFSTHDVNVHVDHLLNDLPCIVNYRNARILYSESGSAQQKLPVVSGCSNSSDGEAGGEPPTWHSDGSSSSDGDVEEQNWAAEADNDTEDAADD